MSEIMSFGADSEDVKSYKFNGFKAKEGEDYRIGIIYWDDNPKTMFRGVQAHYFDKYFICKSTPDKRAICCTHSYDKNRPRWRVGCVIIIYIIEDEKLKGYKLMPWMFSDSMFQKIRKANKGFPLSKHDVTLSLAANTKEEYQTIDIHSCPESFWQLKAELKEKVQEEAKPLMDEIIRNMPADLSIDEIKEVLGIESAGTADAAENINLGDIMSEAL